jgi:hypothetical protein
MKNLQTISTVDLSNVSGGLMREIALNPTQKLANSRALSQGEALCKQFASSDRLDACYLQAHAPLFKAKSVPVTVDGPFQPRSE